MWLDMICHSRGDSFVHMMGALTVGVGAQLSGTHGSPPW